jgi:branched-chain amino acid transport system permease protein
MLTLAFSQIVWAIVFKWNSLTGGDTGFIGIPFPPHLDSKIRFYYFTFAVVALSLFIIRKIVNSPFGRILTTIRENPERTEKSSIPPSAGYSRRFVKTLSGRNLSEST